MKTATILLNCCIMLLCPVVLRGQNPLSLLLVPKHYNGGYNISCHGATDGAIHSQVSGGIPPYQYSWSNAETTQHLLNAGGAGTYTLTVTDANGKTKSASVTLYEPPAVTVSSRISSYGAYQVSRYGASDGRIDLLVSGGVPPYTVSWAGRPDETFFLDQLPEGMYSYGVEDALGCYSAPGIDTLVAPDTLLASVELLDSAAATGSKGGVATVAVSGGVSPYAIAWDNGERGDTARYLRAGPQQVSVRDANGARHDLAFEVPQIAGLTVTLTADTFENGRHLSCFTCTDGIITSSVTGGRAPYTYYWLPGEIEDSVALHARGQGLYILQVTDATGATATAWTSLLAPERPDWEMGGNAGTDPESQFIGTNDSTDVVFRTNNIEALRLGANKNVGIGAAEPTEKLDVAGTVRVRHNLLVDSLQFEPDYENPSLLRTLLVDPQGKLVLSRGGITDTLLAPLHADVHLLDSAATTGSKGGSAYVTVSGGMAPYTVEWSNGEKGDTAHYLRPGGQKVLVADANGTKKTLALEVPLIAPLALSLAADTFPNGRHLSCFTCTDGIITSSVTGGRAPYTYYWLPGEIEDSLSLHARGQGLYILQVTDATGATATAWTSLLAPERPDWEMGGNAETDPEMQFIGTTDSTDMVFRTNNIEALRLGANKNVGIGATEPTEKLDVAGTVRVRENLLVDSLQFTHDYHHPVLLRTVLVDPQGKFVLGSGGITDTLLAPLHADVYLLDSAATTGSKGGSAYVSVSGGMPPYTVEWNNGEKGDTAHYLRPGGQKVLVADANGTKKTLALEVPLIAPLALSLAADTFPNGRHLSCFNCSDGSIVSSVSGGREPYTYRWLPGEIEDSVALHARGQGLYVLQVTDATGATATAWTSLLAPERPDWTMEGNAGTDPEMQFIGTTDPTDVVFKTNSMETFRLKADGAIGVGIAEPTARMDIGGTVRIREKLQVDSLRFTTSEGNPATHRLLVVDEDGNILLTPFGLGEDGILPHFPTIPCAYEPVCNKGTLSTAWKRPNNELTGSPLCGNQYDKYVRTCSMVGIGYNPGGANDYPALPRYQLDVAGITYTDRLKVGEHNTFDNSNIPRLKVIGISTFEGAFIVDGNSDFTGNVDVKGNSEFSGDMQVNLFNNQSVTIDHSGTNGTALRVKGNDYGIVTEVNAATSRAFVVRGPVPSNSFYTENPNFAPAVANGMRDNFIIDGNGYVSIGVKDWRDGETESLLAVGGLISSRAFRLRPVDTQLPDYVFYEDYQLPGLDSVAAFVQENCHLPGVSSEEEVRQDGLDVYKMQTQQLEQVERLYLYMIDLEKRLRNTEEELRTLKNKRSE